MRLASKTMLAKSNAVADQLIARKIVYPDENLLPLRSLASHSRFLASLHHLLKHDPRGMTINVQLFLDDYLFAFLREFVEELKANKRLSSLRKEEEEKRKGELEGDLDGSQKSPTHKPISREDSKSEMIAEALVFLQGGDEGEDTNKSPKESNGIPKPHNAREQPDAPPVSSRRAKVAKT
eukprot:TRINITY_DN3200_c0_g1_i2.p1 TRINITY_DN3200_c0_g1~~TRINITY_DN3200_c0_g1_i2.p1  ORF type:complete len:180 (-),score=36.73 TRINITY_DN3200_c0_g1_i2:13-552(-)